MKALTGASALMPIVLFLVLFIGSGVYFTIQGVDYAFYKVSPTVAIFPAAVLAIAMGGKKTLENIETFITGVRDHNIITMCVIYLLAGAYTAVLKGIGGVDATVFFSLDLIPVELTVPGIFVIAALVSTAMGTSMGTVAAVCPVALGMAQATGIDTSVMVGAVVGGAMFGDNLSMISDTTIAATQIHPCSLKDKFIMNGKIAFPAFILTIITLLFFIDGGGHQDYVIPDYNVWLCLPYFAVLVLALMGINVFLVLTLGIILAAFTGFVMVDGFTLVNLSELMFDGYKSMTEILILSLLIGGLSYLAKAQKGFDFIINLTDRFVKKFATHAQGSRVAEGAIAVLASLCDVFTANNVVAIILSGEATQEIADRYKVTKLRAAVLVDMFSSVFQGILPYSAQILLAGSIAGLSPLAIIFNVHYCFYLGFSGIVAICLRWPKEKA